MTYCTICGKDITLNLCKCQHIIRDKHNASIRYEALQEANARIRELEEANNIKARMIEDEYLPTIDRLEAMLKPSGKALGTEENPFVGTFNAICFKRHDSDLFISVSERDYGFDIIVSPHMACSTTHYYISGDGVVALLGVKE